METSVGRTWATSGSTCCAACLAGPDEENFGKHQCGKQGSINEVVISCYVLFFKTMIDDCGEFINVVCFLECGFVDVYSFLKKDAEVQDAPFAMYQTLQLGPLAG